MWLPLRFGSLCGRSCRPIHGRRGLALGFISYQRQRTFGFIRLIAGCKKCIAQLFSTSGLELSCNWYSLRRSECFELRPYLPCRTGCRARWISGQRLRLRKSLSIYALAVAWPIFEVPRTRSRPSSSVPKSHCAHLRDTVCMARSARLLQRVWQLLQPPYSISSPCPMRSQLCRVAGHGYQGNGWVLQASTLRQ